MNKLLTEKELVEKCMPTLERFEEVEKQVFYPIPKPVEFSATIRIYASTISREAVRKTLAKIREVVGGAGLTDEEILYARAGVILDWMEAHPVLKTPVFVAEFVISQECRNLMDKAIANATKQAILKAIKEE